MSEAATLLTKQLEEKGIKLSEENTFEDIYDIAKDIKTNSKDFPLVPERSLLVKIENEYKLTFTFDFTDHTYELKPWALTNLCLFHKIPKRYVTTMYNDRLFHLIETNINTYTANEEKRKVLIRVLNDKVRAIRGKNFDCYDNLNMLDDFKPFADNYDLTSSYIDDEIMIVRVYEKNPFTINYNGENVNAYIGFQLKNSEVGLASTDISLLIMIQINNKNMEILKGSLIRKIHRKRLQTSNIKIDINIAITEFENNKKDIQNQVQSLVNTNINKEKLESFMNRLKAMVNKTEYNVIFASVPKKIDAFTLGATVLGTVSDYNFDKKEDIEALVGDLLF